ncbi:NAD-dependent succinate-semialdehyde dehydrogenase [Gluconobacter wancherniae]|uniref:NAD-dependent succinate-semialdehyde dehydrogenase n=1 Tax=Gluconobacter wancherniae NBRC 103581 TaxID=656744 RepID=A0A511B2F0_9PROT|nr:NAD-dependent succinate-semialdehyde dehydrogenase [Gluconobacter wancherniae]MBF0854808.1 NAD-dependent succinate-semialdehyde dehydrogenase [Gluconobacter wancherniae]GBD57879.1 NAD-dependent succinate-semialdehyde dehydrogenase [Gluconobacter wancherniae NBRC 103581]GBR61874.1 aldehyde/betaine dehydrogenase [Gluconobacter wancherniae NBRC 103581]GEK94594.1 NAD-dependent succinate-semialdehyde dehydrogenase [Gluconobacter wancherniae NBRC 103581]
MTLSLNDSDLFRQHAFVGGEWKVSGSGKTMTVDNPSTGETIGSIPACTADETRSAIESARIAQIAWRRSSAAERSALLMGWYQLMLDNLDDLATIMTLEQGKPLAEARGEVTYAASFLKWFAAEAEHLQGSALVPTADRRIIVLKEPVGVTAAITPWNFPLAMITRKCAPAIAAGCSMVIKPSELTPYSALALAVLAERAGLPKGLLSVVTGYAQEIGPELTSSSVVRKLSFTGSTKIGALLMRQSADTIKKLSLELGGNAPLIVFDDADLAGAVAGTMVSKFRNAGQTCVCANRVYVQSGIHDAFLEKLAAEIASLKTGDGFDPQTQIGPLINEAAVAKVKEHVDDALAKGARIVGKPLEINGRFASPVLLADVTSDMRIAQEETFGPVLPVFRFENEDDAVQQANATPFGLASYFFTNDITRAWRVGEALDFGMVGLNTGSVSMVSAPFGGVKQSGLGREGGALGLEEFLEVKSFHMGLPAA